MSLVLKSNTAYTGDVNALPFLYDMSFVDNAISIVGTRLLTASYTGALLRVRRVSDGAEKDIFTVGQGQLDTAALLSFVGAGDGTVSIMYDQGGKANNFSRSLATGQPFIVKAGVLQVASDGQPCLALDVTKRALFLNFPPKTPQSYLGGFVEGVYTDTAFAVIDGGVSKSTFRLDNVFKAGNFLYREAAGQTVVTLVLTNKPVNNARTFVALDGVANLAIAKDAASTVTRALVNYVPISSTSNVVLGSSNDDGTASNMQGYITAFALVNNAADGNALLSLVE